MRVEPGPDRLDVAGLAVVRRAGQGELDVGAGEGVGCSRLDQREGLEGLDRGTGVHEAVDVAPGPQQRPTGVDHGGVDLVHALGLRSAPELDDRSVGGRRTQGRDRWSQSGDAGTG